MQQLSRFLITMRQVTEGDFNPLDRTFIRNFSNLDVRMLQQTGIEADAFGGSTKVLDEV